MSDGFELRLRLKWLLTRYMLFYKACIQVIYTQVLWVKSMNADECIFFQLAKAGKLGARFWGHKVSDLSITPVQAMVLRFLYDQDQITSIDLGKKTELDSATLTGVIDRLENAGIIDRKDNPHDRRSIRIYLTEKGKITGEEIARRMEEANADFLKAFTPKEAGKLRRLIHTLRNQSLR